MAKITRKAREKGAEGAEWLAGKLDPTAAEDLPLEQEELAAGAARRATRVAAVSDDALRRASRQLYQAARIAESTPGDRAARQVLDRNVKRFAGVLEGKPAAQVRVPKMRVVQSILRQAVRAGATAEELGILAAGTLRETGAVSPETAVRTRRVAPGMGAETKAAMGRTAAGARVGKMGRYLRKPAVGGAAAFGGLMILEGLIGRAREARTQRDELQALLAEAGGVGEGERGITPFGPMHTMEFVEAMGPEVLDALTEDPALALELHQRLQSMAMAAIPEGAAVLRTGSAGAAGAMDMRALLEQLGEQ